MPIVWKTQFLKLRMTLIKWSRDNIEWMIQTWCCKYNLKTNAIWAVIWLHLCWMTVHSPVIFYQRLEIRDWDRHKRFPPCHLMSHISWSCNVTSLFHFLSVRRILAPKSPDSTVLWYLHRVQTTSRPILLNRSLTLTVGFFFLHFWLVSSLIFR